MPDGADLILDTDKLMRDGDRLVRRYLSAGTQTINTVTKRLERNLEAATRSAVPGRLWRAWASDAYPRKGPARNPTGTIFVNGGSRTRGAIKFWTEPGAIRGREGQWLAIPLPAAGPRGRDRMLTPLEWETSHNIELEFVPRPGKWPLLVAQQGRLSGRSGTVARRSQRQAVADIGRASRVSVPIFVLIPVLKFRNTVAVETLVKAAQGDLVGEYLNAVQTLT